MAAGQYVKTYAGAIAQNAQATVLQALAGGIPPSQALEARFPSLPHDVAVNLSRQLSRGTAAQEVRGGRALAERAAVPGRATVTRVPGLPVDARYVVATVFEDENGTQQKIVHVIDTLGPGATWEQIQAEAARKEAILAANPRDESPAAIAAREAADLPELPPPVLLKAEFKA